VRRVRAIHQISSSGLDVSRQAVTDHDQRSRQQLDEEPEEQGIEGHTRNK